MTTITSIGVINTQNKSHREFFNTYMEHNLQTECALTYELWKNDEPELAVITSERINNIINELLHINQTTLIAL